MSLLIKNAEIITADQRYKADIRCDGETITSIGPKLTAPPGAEIIDATGKPSRNNVIQRYGRGVRQAEGKTELLFYDIADRGNSKFTDAAWARYRALKETGAPITILRDSSTQTLAAAKAGKPR